MSRTYAIADLHGRFDLLCKAIDMIEADAGEDGGRLIILGDFVDRGPQSRNIIDLLMAGPQRPNWEWTVLQGNHEAMMLVALTSPTPELLRWWVGNGGGQTLQSYGYAQGDNLTPLRVPGDHLKWLAELPIVVEDKHRIYVHAGVPFEQQVADAKPETMQWMLYAGYDPGGDSAEIMPDEQHVSGKHIVHGHEQSASHPLRKRHRTNLDSFAWATGHLAIGVWDDDYPDGPMRILDVIGKPMLAGAA